MIDIHTHVLPAVDDGSRSPGESAEMLKHMYCQGIRSVVATPHFDMRKGDIDSFLERRTRGWERLKPLYRPNEMPEIVFGAEVLYCGTPLNRMVEIDKLCLGDSNYMLIESLTERWDEDFEVCMRRLLVEQNIIPVLAHIERYEHDRNNRKILLRLQREGVLGQANAGLFVHRLSRYHGIYLLKKGTVQLLGSDCHGITWRPPNLKMATEQIEKKMGQQQVQQLMLNAAKVIGKRVLEG